MAPAIGIGALALTGILFVAWLIFLAEQQKLQDDLARLWKVQQEGHGRSEGISNPLIDVWMCPNCGFMSTKHPNCLRCFYPRPHDTPDLRIHFREYTEQSKRAHPAIYVPPKVVPVSHFEETALDPSRAASTEDPMVRLRKREQGEDDQWWSELKQPAVSLTRRDVF